MPTYTIMLITAQEIPTKIVCVDFIVSYPTIQIGRWTIHLFDVLVECRVKRIWRDLNLLSKTSVTGTSQTDEVTASCTWQISTLLNVFSRMMFACIGCFRVCEIYWLAIGWPDWFIGLSWKLWNFSFPTFLISLTSLNLPFSASPTPFRPCFYCQLSVVSLSLPFHPCSLPSSTSNMVNKKAVLSQRWPRDARYVSRSWAVAEI